MPRLAPPVVVEDARVPMPDGMRLAADVMRVDDGARRPVLLLRSPYLRVAVRLNVDVVALARAGWVVVGQDTRGRGESEGDAEPFVSEAADGAATVAWCARQPWSNGRVAMWGGSYLGFTQWAAASRRPPALRAIGPLAAPTDLLRDWHYEGGAFCTGIATTWSALMAAADTSLSKRDRARIAALSADWRTLLGFPHAKQPLAELYAPYRQLLDPRDRSYWGAFDLTRRYRRMDVAAIQLAGWYDIFCEGSIRAWQALSQEAPSEYARASQRLVIGPWTHTGMLLPATPELDFGPAANGAADGTLDTTLTWLRDAVDGKPVQGGVRAFVMGRNDWAELAEWPPPSKPVDLFIGSTVGARSSNGDGRLTGTPGESGSDRFLHDPADPVPTRGGRILGPWLPVAGPSDQRLVEERGDVLVYTSQLLTEDLTIIGGVEGSVVFETTGRSADVTMKLVDVHPDGRAFNVLDSVKRSAFTPGRPKEITVALGSVAQTFLRGHRIRLEIASSNFPRFDVNASTGQALIDVAQHEPAQQTVHHGSRTGSRIVLPVVSGTLR